MSTHFHPDCPIEVQEVLERARLNHMRIRVHYGDMNTGRDWMDQYNVTGRVGRSMGPKKVPILLHNSRSIGGVSILTNCVIRIRHANKTEGGDLYCHPKYSAKLPAPSRSKVS